MVRPTRPRFVAVVGRTNGVGVTAVSAVGGDLCSFEVRVDEEGATERGDEFLRRCAAVQPSPVLGVVSAPLRFGNKFESTECAVLAAEIWDEATDEGPSQWCACTVRFGKVYALELEVDASSKPKITAVLAAHNITGRRSALANFNVAFLSKWPKRRRPGVAIEIASTVFELANSSQLQESELPIETLVWASVEVTTSLDDDAVVPCHEIEPPCEPWFAPSGSFDFVDGAAP